jgi:uncharacterized protein with PQ loop repeat
MVTGEESAKDFQRRDGRARLMNATNLIGWTSSVVLLSTLIRQVYVQSKTRSSAGLSKWLFLGQVTASLGFTIYSVLLHNWIYVSSNAAILVTALVGEFLYLRNKQSAGTEAPGL